MIHQSGEVGFPTTVIFNNSATSFHRQIAMDMVGSQRAEARPLMSSKYLSAGLIFIAAVIVGVVLVYPKYQVFRVSGKAVDEKQSELDAQAALINEINKTKSKYKKAEDDLLKVSDLLPAFGPKSVAELFIELESIASESGILIQTINFGSTLEQKDGKPAEGYKTIDARLSVVASYGAFKKFAATVEKNQHLMDITDITIAKGAAQKKETNAKESSSSIENIITEINPESAVFNYSVTLNAYYQ